MAVEIRIGDALEQLRQMPPESVHCCLTSPPYWGLRAYLDDNDPSKHLEMGSEETPDEWCARLVEVFREVKRVLRKDGTCFVNLGDSYAGSWGAQGHRETPTSISCNSIKNHPKKASNTGTIKQAGLKPKDLIGQPWMLAFALRADGWWLRDPIVWHKVNPMPSSATDRCTGSYEMLFMLSKRARYFYDGEALKQHIGSEAWPRNVWSIATEPFKGWFETSHQVRVAADAPLDGKKRRASLNCPVHAGRAAQAATALDGGREADPQPRNSGNGSHPALAQPVGSAPIEQRHEQAIAPASSGSPRPSRSLSATSHSSETRRTVRAPETSPACTPCAQSPAHTGGTSEQPASFEQDLGRYESSSELDGSGASHTHQTAGRTAHTSSASVSCEPSNLSECTCEWYIEETSKSSHFATFPTELARRCILAGTSSKGVCADCGAPWIRIIEPTGRMIQQQNGPTTVKAHIQANGPHGATSSLTTGYSPEKVTTGWQPTCKCEADRAQATVLDPFGGAGTTALVADRLQRNAILIELNAEYAAMARKRIDGDRGDLLDIIEQPKPEQGSLCLVP